MNIAELFINLGVTGADKTSGALSGVKKSLDDTKSMALEAKVAIVGAVYALERLFAASGQKGTDLTNFNSVIGMSTKTLQQYEYAARQVGASNEEMDTTFKSIQSSMTKTLMGEGAPKGLARVAQITGDINPETIKRFSEHPEELIQRLQKYAATEKDKGLKNEVLRSFGLGDNIIAGLNRQAFTPQQLQKAPTYSDKETGQLDKNRASWSNLGNTIEMAVGHFNAKHGQELVEGISKVLPKVIELVNAFMKLSEALKLFEWFGKMIEGWSEIFNVITGSVNAVTGAITDPKKADALKNKVGSFITSDLPTMAKYAASSVFGGGEKSALAPASAGGVDASGKISPRGASPTMPGQPATQNNTQNINVNQNLNFQHDGKDAVKTGDSVKKAVNAAVRSNPAQAGGY